MTTKNSFTAFVEFDFRGKSFTPSLEFDLDNIMASHGELPEDLHLIIAQANDIGTYSYELDVMESEPVQYRDIQGFVGEYINDGVFDAYEFEKRWHIENTRAQLKLIAQTHLGETALQEDSELYKALSAAYELGKKDGLRHRVIR